MIYIFKNKVVLLAINYLLKKCLVFVGELMGQPSNKPIYVRMAILVNLSKTVLYKFHYQYIKEKYGYMDINTRYMYIM